MKEPAGRETEILEVPYRHTAEYLYSYGEISKFFKEVKENKKLYATKCPSCKKVWMHPRGHCPDCYTEMEWVPLSGKGTVESAAYCFHAPGVRVADALGDLPFVLAVIKLDGADTAEGGRCEDHPRDALVAPEQPHHGGEHGQSEPHGVQRAQPLDGLLPDLFTGDRGQRHRAGWAHHRLPRICVDQQGWGLRGTQTGPGP